MPDLTAIKKGDLVYRANRCPYTTSVTEHTVRFTRSGVIYLDNGETFHAGSGQGFFKDRTGTYSEEYRIFANPASLQEYNKVLLLRQEATRLMRNHDIYHMNSKQLTQLIELLNPPESPH